MYRWQTGDPTGAPVHSGRGYLPYGVPALAVTDATVAWANRLSTGLAVQLKFGSYIANYIHLDKVMVHKGQKVKAGEIIGIIGEYADVNHLHFELAKGRDYFDPARSLSRAKMQITPYTPPPRVLPGSITSVAVGATMGVPGLVYYFWKRKKEATTVWPRRDVTQV